MLVHVDNIMKTSVGKMGEYVWECFRYREAKVLEKKVYKFALTMMIIAHYIWSINAKVPFSLKENLKNLRVQTLKIKLKKF